MSKELLVKSTSGQNVYAVARIAIRTNIGKWGKVDSEELESFNGDNWRKYAIDMTELGTTGFYEADVPVFLVTERAMDIFYYVRAGAHAAQGDSILSGTLLEYIEEWVPTTSLDV